MSDETGRSDQEERRRSIRRTLKRPLSLAVVAATLMGSLLLVERTDTADTGTTEAAIDGQLVDHRPRPSKALTVEAAIEAGEYAAADARIAIARVGGGGFEGREDQACAFLLEARARFIVRIDILIDRVPDAEDELLEIRAEVLAEIDAALGDLECDISP